MIDVEPRPVVPPRGGAVQHYVARTAARAHALDLHFSLPVVALLLGLMLAPVLLHGGWPLNHEQMSWKYRLLIYAAHFRRLELLPIWSESAAYGLGGPAPVLYHKLFYLVAAAGYLLFGSIKVTLITVLGAFSVLGLLGMRASLCRLGVPARAALVAAAALWFCNYSYTDWIVRAAFAEYSALQLLPWLFYWLIGLFTGAAARSTFRLGALLFPALYLAHAVLFFFAAVPVVSALAWRLLRGPDRKALALAVLGIGGIFAAVALPIGVCQLAVVRELDFADGIAIFQPQDSYASLAEHLTGGAYVWGATWRGCSVQIDVLLVAAAVVALLATGWAALRRRTLLQRLPAGGLAAYAAIWLWAGYYAFLLSPASAALYRALPGFAMLQFPWRLLAFISVASVTLAAYPWLARAQRKPNTALGWACLLLAGTYGASPWLRPIRYAWIPASELEAGPPPAAQIQIAGFEYHPKVDGVSGADLIDYARRLSPSPEERQWTAGDYNVERLDEPSFESGRRTYRLHVAHPATVVLPIAYSPFIRVDAVSPAGRERIPTKRLPRDPRIHFDAPQGDRTVRVTFPTLLSLYADLIDRFRAP